MTATFMPKPFTDRTGTGLHMHMSLWRDGEPLFPDPADRRGLGLSGLAYQFIAGVLAHAPALLAVIAPTVNSYKRTTAAAPASGATWAPTAASFGGNDRTHMIRVPDGDRIEVRACDGSANPYLAMAALLTAGLDGIDQGLDPGELGGGRRAAAADLAARGGRAGRRPGDQRLPWTRRPGRSTGLGLLRQQVKREEFLDLARPGQ